MKMNFAEIDAKVLELEMIESQIKSLEAMKDSLKGDLKSALDEEKVDCIDTGLNKIWYKPVCKKVVDVEKLKHESVYEKYSKEQVIIQFKVTKSN